MKISAHTVRTATVGERDQFIWDGELKGFGLKVTKSGKKVYVLQYRMGGRATATRRYTIGMHGSPWTAAGARKEAEQLLLRVRGGYDPREDKREAIREAVDLRFDHYAAKFLQLYAREQWADSTRRNHESNLARWIIPSLKDKSLARIDKRDITGMLDRIPASSRALRRDVFKLVRRITNWAVERGDIEQSPLVGLRAPGAVPSRDRVLTDAEIHVILSYTHDEPEWAVWGPFVRLLLLSGQRRTEVARMEWRELDRASHTWIIAGNRTKNRRDHLVPLSDVMIHELDQLAGGEAWPKVGLVLQHAPGKHLSGFSKMKRRLDDILAESGNALAREWRLHDLRRTYATGLQRLGIRFEVIAALQNHRSVEANGSTGPYHRYTWEDEKHEAMQAWANYLTDMICSVEAECVS